MLAAASLAMPFHPPTSPFEDIEADGMHCPGPPERPVPGTACPPPMLPLYQPGPSGQVPGKQTPELSLHGSGGDHADP